jgi:uncharacterized membrane-anchored protein YjiN (DUF445 family)
MVALPPNSNTAAARLRRMKLLATGLLALMAGLFVTATLLHLAPLRAFAEAAMVGAIADWFAVVALFRRPLGLPIPHTAIIPRNKDRIGRALGDFMANNFLAPGLVGERLERLDAAARLAQWLAQPETTRKLAQRAAALAPVLVDALDGPEAAAFARNGLNGALRTIPAAPLAARVLAVLMTQGHHQTLFDRFLDGAEAFLDGHADGVRQQVSGHSWRWLPGWLDRKLADKVVDGSRDLLAELRDPAHPWRAEFEDSAVELCRRLAQDPDLRAQGEAVKAEVLAHPAVQAALDGAWEAGKSRLRAALAEDGRALVPAAERLLSTLAARLDDDPHLRAVLNRWLRRVVERLVVPNRAAIGDFIASVVTRWDARTMADKLELHVGRDLQYIRLSGTLVGGCVGLAIHGLSRLLG